MFPESEIDKLTEVIGVFGKFQFTYTVLYGMSAIVMAFSGLGTKFLIYDVDHWCTRCQFHQRSINSLLASRFMLILPAHSVEQACQTQTTVRAAH